MTIRNQNFELYAGDSKQIIVTVTDTNGVVDLTGAKIKWALKPSVLAEALVSKDTNSGITITSSDTFRVDLASADTKDVDPAIYYHEAEVTDITGNVSTVFVGTVRVISSGV